MKTKLVFARVLAIVGTLLVWFPILVMIVTGIIGSIQAQRIRMDYLIPAELFPFVGGGSILLVVAVLLARSQRKWIIWSFVAMLLSLVGGQAIAFFSGLAQGKIEPVGIWWSLVLVMIGVYILTVIAIGIGGIRLIVSVFSKNGQDSG